MKPDRSAKPDEAAPSKRASPAWKALVLTLKGLWIALVVTTPLLGAWVASSLAAYANGPVVVAAASALLAFPLLPLLWEYVSARRRRRNKAAKPRILTFTDRLILRTLALNLLFLGVLIGTQPQTAFTALSTRGDWMLDGEQGAAAKRIRAGLFWTADRLEWLYVAFNDNPFDQGDEKKDTPPPLPASNSATSSRVPSPVPAPSVSGGPSPSPSEKPSSDVSPPTAGNAPSSDSRRAAFASTDWPPPAQALHPAVADMPKDAEQSIQTVARYIAERESDPAGRFRAAHDWVADRIAYDGPSYVAHRYPPQDAESVFRARVAVCAGYSKLLAALGRELGLDVSYVVGDARTSGNSESGDSHAWSAVKLGDRYYLADVTWNSGTLSGSTFTKRYRTDYLFAPPEVFGLDHFPNDARWQLRASPISRGDFFRQAMMTPRFYAEGRELLTPQRSQVTVSGPFTAEIKTRPGLWTLAAWTVDPAQSGTNCTTDNGPITRVTCELPGKGRYLVRLFSGAQQYGKFEYIGQFEANRE